MIRWSKRARTRTWKHGEEAELSVASAAVQVMLPTSPFPPLAVGFGLGTGYLIYGTQELVGYPKRDEQVDVASGMWGIWMPGFLQFITGSTCSSG